MPATVAASRLMMAMQMMDMPMMMGMPMMCRARFGLLSGFARG